MKRHDALAPLSREHHNSLILSRLLRIDAPPYRELPTAPAEKINYALAEYHSHILPHFKKEEAVFHLLEGANEKVDALTRELENEHRQIELQFSQLNAASPDTHLMNELGTALDNHIRKEERILFPLIQESIEEPLFDQIRSLL